MRTAQILKFVSRAEHLKWREAWKRGRWVRLSGPPAERAAILRQDEEYRLGDIRWATRHGPIPGGAVVLSVGIEPLLWSVVSRVEGESRFTQRL